MKTIKNKKGTELVTRKEVKDSPFVIVTNEKGSFGTVGKFRITEIHKTPEEAEKEATEMSWNNIVKIITIVVESLKDFETLTNKQ